MQKKLLQLIKQIVKSGRKVLFVATKKQAKDIVAEYAKNVNMPLSHRKVAGRDVNQLRYRTQVDQKDVEHR